jgi:hypothetical protein
MLIETTSAGGDVGRTAAPPPSEAGPRLHSGFVSGLPALLAVALAALGFLADVGRNPTVLSTLLTAAAVILTWNALLCCAGGRAGPHNRHSVNHARENPVNRSYRRRDGPVSAPAACSRGWRAVRAAARVRR